MTTRRIIQMGEHVCGAELLRMAWKGDAEGVEAGGLYERSGPARGRPSAAMGATGGRRHYFRPVLTPRQMQVLRFIIEHREAAGLSPTLEQISDEIGCAHRTGAVCHVDALIAKGFLGREAGKSRSLVPLRGVDGQSVVDWKQRALAAEAEVARLTALLEQREAA